MNPIKFPTWQLFSLVETLEKFLMPNIILLYSRKSRRKQEKKKKESSYHRILVQGGTVAYQELSQKRGWGRGFMKNFKEILKLEKILRNILGLENKLLKILENFWKNLEKNLKPQKNLRKTFLQLEKKSGKILELKKKFRKKI